MIHDSNLSRLASKTLPFMPPRITAPMSNGNIAGPHRDPETILWTLPSE